MNDGIWLALNYFPFSGSGSKSSVQPSGAVGVSGLDEVVAVALGSISSQPGLDVWSGPGAGEAGFSRSVACQTHSTCWRPHTTGGVWPRAWKFNLKRPPDQEGGPAGGISRQLRGRSRSVLLSGQGRTDLVAFLLPCF